MNTLREQDAVSAEDLRAAMVQEMRSSGELRTEQVARAFVTVPRETFAPGAPLRQVYDRDDVVVTKRDPNGLALSSVSAPRIQAQMLEQADIQPGMRVLEIGSGGYNAALIAELVGTTGEVTTVDIDSFVTDRAAQYLAATGYERVRVLRVDAEAGLAERAPFDRIIVTAGAWDVPPAWVEQLADDGLLIVPLRLRGLTRSFALAREDGRLIARNYELCGFVAMQGAGAYDERLILLQGEDVGLRVDDHQDVPSPDSLRSALASQRVAVGSGVEVGGFEPFDDLDLFVATRLDDFGLLVAKDAAIAGGVVERSARMGAKTALSPDSFAYRSSQPTSADRTSFEFVVHGHGPQAGALADRYVGLIREWNQLHRGEPGARVEVFAAGADVRVPAGGRLIEKKHTNVLISWPPAS